MGNIVADGAEAVSLFQLLAAKSAIKLEKLGMKHSRGSVRKNWAVHLGLKPTAKADVVIDAIEAKIKTLRDAGVGFTEV